jgi:hypothetical protein
MISNSIGVKYFLSSNFKFMERKRHNKEMDLKWFLRGVENMRAWVLGDGNRELVRHKSTKALKFTKISESGFIGFEN